MSKGRWIPTACALSIVVAAFGQTVPVTPNLWRLVQQEDTDGDRRITRHDRVTPFEVWDKHRLRAVTVGGVYPLSVLLQELKRAEEQHRPELGLDEVRLDENPVDRTHRLIRTYFWDALTRRIDAEHLDQVLPDPKVVSKGDFLYVPAADKVALAYFRRSEAAAKEQKRSPILRVLPVPMPSPMPGQRLDTIHPHSGPSSGAFVRDLDGQHGLLCLKLETNQNGRLAGVPYVVPGGRFNELYYWDSYFIILGLLADGRLDLARNQVDNLVYEIQNYGLAPNANRTYYLTRSQPPLLTSMIRAVYAAAPGDKRWLETALQAAVTEYERVWMGPDRRVKVGRHVLNRYFDTGDGPCPEVEPGHYDERLAPWLAQARTAAGSAPRPAELSPQRFLNEYLYCGSYGALSVDGVTLDQFFNHDRALRESGHDTTHRFDDRTSDFLPCDLNALLYKYERDFCFFLEREFNGKLASLGPECGRATYWREQALARKAAMDELMWDEQQGFFFDYDFARRCRSRYVSATGLYPLWAGMLESQHEGSRAQRVAALSRRKLEQLSGLSASARESVETPHAHDLRQWDYPYGWPPHQMLAWQGLRNYGLDAEAERLAYRWLYTIVKNARDFNGTVPEKYNVVTGSHEVFVEYGNVGTRFAYLTPEGFGWMNASFEVGLALLSPTRLQELKALSPPPPAETRGSDQRQ